MQEGKGEDQVKNYDFPSGLFLTVMSIGTAILAYRLGLGNMHDPGPGLIPFGTAFVLGWMSIGLWFRSLFQRIREYQEGEGFKGVNWIRVVLVLCTLLGYGMAFNVLGFRICAFLLMVLLLAVVGRQKWWSILTISFFTVLFAYLIFVVWLGCVFPKGPFGI